MAESVTPDGFNERFTTNADGKPVWRTLCEMTVDEVISAGEMLDAEVTRLDALATPFVHRDRDAELAAFLTGRLTQEEALSRSNYSLAVLEAAIEARNRRRRFDEAVLSTIPEHTRDNLTIEALRRHWPR